MKNYNCIAPHCKSSSTTTPEKLFITAPKDKRNVWLELAKLDPTMYSQNTKLHFCEDHFDIINDMENYMQYKLMGSVKRIRMKTDCQPSRFYCQSGRHLLAPGTRCVQNDNVSIVEEAERTLNTQIDRQGELFLRELKKNTASKMLKNNELNDVKTETENSDRWVQTIKTESLHIGEVIIKNEVSTVECLQCSKSFNTEIELSEHVCEVFQCDICNKSLTSIAFLKKHINRIHLNDKKMHECSWCNKSFPQRRRLIEHERVHTGERPYRCTICKRSFKVKSALIGHTHIHTGVKPYKCAVCGRSFRLKSVFIVHKRLHTGERPFECYLCKKKFSQKSNLSNHKCEQTNDEVYNCPICEKTFQNKLYFNEHTLQRCKRLYRCAVCKKVFTEKDYLKRHERVHTSVKPFTCSICNKSFLRKFQLTLHQRLHTGERPHKCFYCHKSFIQSCHLSTHIRNVHENNAKNTNFINVGSDKITTMIKEENVDRLDVNVKCDIIEIAQVIIKTEDID